jgi:hypothetical protein
LTEKELSYRKLHKRHNEEFHNIYSSANIIRMINSKEDEMGTACSRMGETRNEYRILVGKPEEMRPLFFFFIIWFVRLLALRPLLAYCANLG